MATYRKKYSNPQHASIACTFQGGGALGAYQAGVLRALDEAGYYPDWFVGTSIGAINAAIAAGNPENLRVEKMYDFWESIATPTSNIPLGIPDPTLNRQVEHLLSAQASLFLGQPGFYVPRFPSPEFSWNKSADSISYYDTSPLRSTLERFVDFDRINSKKITRLSVGAVEVCTGEMIYFDSHKEKLTPEHIMASGALPPGFPAVEVNGKLYWDGGISNNTPLTYVLRNNEQKHLLCFMVNLFDSYGLNPKNLDEILKRKKDIEFSSRFNLVIKLYKEIHVLKNSIHMLSKKMTKAQSADRDLHLCISRGHESTISLVHFLYKQDETEFSSKDFEFSEKTTKERLSKGYRDGKKAIKTSPWEEPVSAADGIALHEISPCNKMNKESHHE